MAGLAQDEQKLFKFPKLEYSEGDFAIRGQLVRNNYGQHLNISVII
jgi:hypothetical protein